MATSQAELPGIAMRRVLFSGAISAISVIAGWLIYFAFLAGIGALIAAVVGATIAAVIHAVQHYFHVARHEAIAAGQDQAQHPVASEHGSPHAPRRPSFAAAAQAGAIILGFVGIVSVHVVTELTHELLIPCLVSIATLVPIGMLLGAIFSSQKPADLDFPMIAFGIPIGGGLIGLGAAAVAYAAQWAMGQHPEFWPMAGWWVLVGVGLFAAARGRQLNVRRSVIGIGIALVIVLGSAWNSKTTAAISPTSQPSLNERPTSAGVFSLWMLILRSRDDALRAPDIPSHVWDEALAHARREWAEARHRHGEAQDEPDEKLPRSAWGGRLARWCGCAEAGTSAQQSTSSDSTPSTVPSSQPIDQSPSYIAMYPKGPSIWMPSVDFGRLFVQPWDGGRVVCSQLGMGLESGLVRSWLVMLLFSMGLGLAPRVESALRPSDYPSSRTRRMDGLMWLAVCALIFGAVFASRSSNAAHENEAIAEHDRMQTQPFACVAKVDCGGPADVVHSATAWKVARDEYVRATCDGLAAAGFNTIWLDNLDYTMLSAWMIAAEKCGLRVIAPEFDSPTSIFGSPMSFTPTVFASTRTLDSYLSSPTLTGLSLGLVDGPTVRSTELLREIADGRKRDQPRLLTVAEFSTITNAESAAKAIVPGCIALREPRFRGDEGDRAIRERRAVVRAAAQSIGAQFWVIIEADEMIRASDFESSSVGRNTPPFDPAVLRLQINSTILDGAGGVGLNIRQRPPQPPSERPSTLRRDMTFSPPTSVGRETPSESILEAGSSLRRLRTLASTLGKLTVGETNAPNEHTGHSSMASGVHAAKDPAHPDSLNVRIGKIQLRVFTDHHSNRRYLFLLNTDTLDWQRAALPPDEACESWINPETGQALDRGDFQRLILDPGGMILLRASNRQPD